jgi:hypothetical protein
MAAKASIKHATAVINGAFSVPVKSVTHSATTPARIATTLFNVVIVLKIPLSVDPGSSGNCLLNSVTIQLSNTLYISVVLTPPSIRPMNRVAISSVRRVRHERE